MKSMFKIMGGIAAGAALGVVGYTMLNRKTRKKASELGSAMIDEVKSMMK